MVHRLRSPSAWRGALLALATALAPAAASVAQGPPAAAANTPGTIKVTVHDSAGVGIAGAELTVPGTLLHGESDDAGIVQLTSVTYGPATLRVRRLGFRPAAADVVVEPGVAKTVDITLARLAQVLAPVVVTGGKHVYTGHLAGFYERRDRGIGHFFTREEIERQNPAYMTDLMRRVPGVHLVNTRMIRNAVRFRNNQCAPLVWLDGSPLGAGEFDIDALSPRSIEAMEVYSGIATIPMQFTAARGMSNCGVIAIWSRQGEARKKRKKGVSPAAQLAEAVASLSVFTADQVDVPARPDSTGAAHPIYPDSLFAAGINGTVLAEFVVDSTGDVDVDDFNVLSSTHPLFTEAVRQALRYAQFLPAVLKGRPVRQVVQQPFHFVRDSTLKATPLKKEEPN